MSGDDFMRRAIALSHERMEAGEGGPFGAVIVRDGAIVAEGWNQVTSENDPTAHAEIVAIRRACAALDNFVLDDCEIYTSCEPCPMCLSAIYWARLKCLYYGNSKDDAAGIGFDDAYLYREVGLAPGERSVPAIRLLADEALEAFRAWEAKPDKIAY